MYEYKNGHITVPDKQPSNQTGGSFPVKVTVEEKFSEDGVLISRTTTTEYDNSPKTLSWPHTINVTS